MGRTNTNARRQSKRDATMTKSTARSRLSGVSASSRIPWSCKFFSISAGQVIFCIGLVASVRAEDKSPKEIIQAAIDAHGGQENLAKTLTGSLTAKSTAKIGDIEFSITWQETFQLPRRSTEASRDSNRVNQSAWSTRLPTPPVGFVKMRARSRI